MRAPQAQGEQFERDGFVAIPNLITRVEARTLKDEVGRILDDVAREERERGEERPQFLQSGVYVGLSKRSAVCRRLARDPRLLDVMEAVIGPNSLFGSEKVLFKAE